MNMRPNQLGIDDVLSMEPAELGRAVKTVLREAAANAPTPRQQTPSHCAECGNRFREGGIIGDRHLCNPCWGREYDPEAEPDGSEATMVHAPLRTHCVFCERTPVQAGERVCLDCTARWGGDKHAPTKPNITPTKAVEHVWPSHDSGPNWED